MTVSDLLERQSSRQAAERGWQYVDRIASIERLGDGIAATVVGTAEYAVRLMLDGSALHVSCTCPYFIDRGSPCKHLLAVAYRAGEFGWLQQLPTRTRLVASLSVDAAGTGVEPLHDRSATQPPKNAPPTAPPQWAAVLDAVTRRHVHRPAVAWSDSQLIYIITAPPLATQTELPLSIERLERRKDGTWSKPQPSRLTFDVIHQLPDAEDRWALSLLYGLSPYPRIASPFAHTAGYGSGLPLNTVYLTGAILDQLLPRLCATGRVRLRPASRNANVPSVSATGDVTLHWDDDEPWRLELVVDHDLAYAPGSVSPTSAPVPVYRVEAVLRREGNRVVGLRDASVLTDSLAFIGDAVARFDPSGGFRWAAQLRSRGATLVPIGARRMLVEALVHSGAAHVRVPDDLRWEQRRAAPRFQVEIGAPSPYSGACPVAAMAVYDEAAVPITDGGTHVLNGEATVVYVRDRQAEDAALALLERLGVARLASHWGEPPTISHRRLPALVRALLAEGWQVDAEGVRYRSLSAPRLRISTGIDWFEIETVTEEGVRLDVPELLKAVASGRNTVRLGDGTLGMLPEEWLARVAPALLLGEVEGARVRFRPSQVALIDVLLAEQPAVSWDEGFARAKRRLERFEGVRSGNAPPTFRGTLREYQREALGWMRFLREFGFGGCLADDMGLGKTVMVLAMLDERRTDASRARRPSLVIVPRSLLFNWQREAARFAPELQVLDFAHADRHEASDAIGSADVVLTTYGTLRRDVAHLKDHHFDYVVLDEAQAIKNAGTATAKAVRLLQADHRLALTGTPVENHLGELQSLFDFLNPGLLGRGSVLQVKKRMPADAASDRVARLARGLRPFFLRRTKEQVAPELPPRTEETLYCELEGEQLASYRELRDYYRANLLRMVARHGMARSRFQILEALLRLRQAACHTGLIATDGHRMPGRHPSSRNTGHASAKFDVLIPRLAELVEDRRKALVFSQFTGLLALLRERLDASGIEYEYLDGHTRDREERVARFQEDASCALFLISLKAGGVGLNLTEAEYVFLLDPWWNPAVEAQAIDRTHRIGQSKPVFAYRLVARGTVEERILDLQARKRALADAILEAGTGGLRDLEREDLEALLS